MMGNTTINSKGYVLGEVSSKGNSDEVATKYGVRSDITHKIDNFTITASLTDVTLKDLDNAPWVKDGLITAETTEGNTNFVLGYDTGAKNVFAGVQHDVEVADKPIRLGATWFQKGNHVRTQAKIRFDTLTEFPALTGTYTFNDEAPVANSTVFNMQEREAFVLAPFTQTVATCAIKYQHEFEGYVFEPYYDINNDGAYLSVYKDDHENLLSYKAQFSIKDQAAMFEIGKRNKFGEKPFVKAFVRTPVGESSNTQLAIGLIFDKNFDA